MILVILQINLTDTLLILHVTSYNGHSHSITEHGKTQNKSVHLFISSNLPPGTYTGGVVELIYKSTQYLLRLLYIHVTGEGNFVSVAEKSKTLLYYIWNSTVVSQTGGSWWRTKSAQYFLQHVTAFSTFIWSIQEYTKKDAVRVCFDSRGVFDNITGNLAYKSNRY